MGKFKILKTLHSHLINEGINQSSDITHSHMFPLPTHMFTFEKLLPFQKILFLYLLLSPFSKEYNFFGSIS